MIRSTILQIGLACLVALGATAAHAESDVQQLADKWVKAYNAHDRNALEAVYAPDAKLMMHGAETIAGHKAIGDFWAKDFTVDDPLTILHVTHSVSGVDMILVHGDYQVVSRNDGHQLGFGRFAHIWMQADNGEWRLDRDLWNQPYTPVPANN